MQCSLDNWRSLKLADGITGGSMFRSADDIPVAITVFLCDAYQDANEIAKPIHFRINGTVGASLEIVVYRRAIG